MSARQVPAVDQLARHLADGRGHRVVFLAHCLLNENTRYLGGACQPGCVREVLDACADAGLGIVQMPCPEQYAWGGVLKRHLLRVYGSRALAPGWVRRGLLPLGLAHTRWRYRRLARGVAAQVADYRRGGFQVVAVVGVDGSPSCGVNRTLDIADALDGLVCLDPGTVTPAQANAIVRNSLAPGMGLYTQALRQRLGRYGPEPPLLAHDLIGELDGRLSTAGAALRCLN